MLGYVYLEHPTMIMPMQFLIKTVTSVTPVTSVIFLRIYCFRFIYKSVTSVICYSPKVFDFISDLYL